MHCLYDTLHIGSSVFQVILGNKHSLVGGLNHFLFSHILGIIIPTDFHIFQRGGSITNQIVFMGVGFFAAELWVLGGALAFHTIRL